MSEVVVTSFAKLTSHHFKHFFKLHPQLLYIIHQYTRLKAKRNSKALIYHRSIMRNESE